MTDPSFNNTPSKAEVEAFHDGFRAFNQRHAPSDHHPFAFTVELAGEVVGGIDGASFWGRLHVENIHVDENLRGRGIGRRLMGMAEDLASIVRDWIPFHEPLDRLSD